MINYLKCPKCDDNLLNIYFTMEPRDKDYVIKSCKLHPNHYFKMKVMDNDFISHVVVRIKNNPPTYAQWVFSENKLYISLREEVIWNSYIIKPIYNEIPFFEPDLSDYDCLVDKLKIYSLFS